MIIDNNYYIYLHVKSSDGTPFYVGKGKAGRCNHTHNRSKFWNNTANKYGFDVLLLEEYLTNNGAIEREVYWINRIGRRDLGTGPLVNLTSGGEGASGRVVSEENKKRIGDMNRGKTFSKETRQKISDAMKRRLKVNPLVGDKNGMYGKVQPKEWRDNHSDMMSLENNPNSKIVLDEQTGIFYSCIREVADTFDINYSTLKGGLNTGKVEFNRFKKI